MRAVVAAGLLLALVASAWWATHPNRFDPVGNRIGTDRAAVGSPLLFGVAADPRSDVDLRTVRARVTENTAGARVRVLLCRDDELIGSAIGPAETTCRGVRPASGATLHPFKKEIDPKLVIEVVPRRPGRVVIDGVRIAYRSGLRWGWQSTGIVVDVTVPASP